MKQTDDPRRGGRRACWGTYIEPAYGDSERREAKDVWDREPGQINTGVLGPDGRPIMRQIRGMDPIGFVRLK